MIKNDRLGINLVLFRTVGYNDWMRAICNVISAIQRDLSPP
ncbi:MAG: hypothetical protein ACTSYZ_09015 [Candidatus Helarchaeota archaeon]